MTPRVDVEALAVPVTLDDVALAVRKSGHSHFPVYEEDLDRLLGVLFVKDLFRPGAYGLAMHGNGSSQVIDVARRVREPYVVPESRPALEILAEMRKARRAFGIVVDEYGGVAGVLTINDLVSELVGDLHDEFDQSAAPGIVRVDRNRCLVDGAVGIDDLRAELGMDVPDGEYVTLGGFVLDLLGRIPKEGDEVQFEGWVLHVTKMDRRRVAKVVVHAPAGRPSGRAGAEQ